MKLHKVKYRNPALDTQACYCINNYLWAKDKIQIINNGKEFLAPKLYCPRHVGQLDAMRRANAKYQAGRPLQMIKRIYQEKQAKKKTGRKQGSTTDRIYKFTVSVSEEEYKLLWNYLYKEVRDPLKDKIRIQTIEEVIEKQKRKKDDKK